MADEETEEPAVELGAGATVEGAPVARVAERLMWGIERSAVVEREGETVIRTPDGPRELGEVLAECDTTYFDTRQSFESVVRDVIGTGPIPTADDDSGPTESSAETTESGEPDRDLEAEGGDSAAGEAEGGDSAAGEAGNRPEDATADASGAAADDAASQDSGDDENESASEESS